MWALARLYEGLTAKIRGEKTDNSPPTFRDGVQNHKVMDAIKRSSDDMMWVAV